MKKIIPLRRRSLDGTGVKLSLMLTALCILPSIWKPDNELIKSGFEAFKLIVTTILGYIFGSNNSKKRR